MAITLKQATGATITIPKAQPQPTPAWATAVLAKGTKPVVPAAPTQFPSPAPYKPPVTPPPVTPAPALPAAVPGGAVAAAPVMLPSALLTKEQPTDSGEMAQLMQFLMMLVFILLLRR